MYELCETQNLKHMKKQVWFVTGASKGLGLSLIKKLLQQNYYVAATSRNKADLENAAGPKSDHFLPLTLDITNEADVARAIKETVNLFGGIDVVVNNAGYGLLGAVEELTDAETRDNFNVNVFASLNVIRQALPHLRQQASGHIINIASIGGFSGNFPGFGIYCATKFAMHGFSEGLYAELKPLGINVTVVSPGYFRTNFLEGSSLKTPKHKLAEYANVRESQRFHEQDMNGNQGGDPEKAADAMIALAGLQQPPLHLFLGEDAYELAYRKIESVKADLEAVREIGTSTGYIKQPAAAQLN